MDADRLIVWDAELRAAHSRLRKALAVTQEAVAAGDDAPDAASDLLLYCTGFCAALDGHHRSEDAALFPALVAEHPQLAPVVEKLVQDHSMLSHLLGALRTALDRRDGAAEITSHLDGIGAIMESHFRYEERQILEPLRSLRLTGDPADALGPL
ncbi:hemerythrin domain-containing protein [Compostimonas suwonensis]|uniref:Hemerythrin-like domain-containing protein n=1 Tax=Compostimonas suwonensis TaxID=1048394 RepID=A0A2M9C0E9_9MICO|nr:hemerythrin domain-containing protein [Compostimonas suwonensis]PJJ63823.1 hemerythrin-like domain-containing protein [Compostimonas suwonensis]